MMRPAERILTREQAEKWAVCRSSDNRPTYPSIGDLAIDVRGAWPIVFCQHQGSRCGGAVGMSIDFGQRQFGYCGGVIDRADVIKLRDYLTQWIDRTLETIVESDTPMVVE